LLTAVVLLAFEQIQESEGSRTAVDWVRVVVGVVLLLAAGRKWRARPRNGAQAELPAWMSRVNELSIRRAARMGALLGGINPKNVVFTLAAASSIAELVDDGVNEFAAAALFVGLSSITVVGATALQLFAGNRGGGALTAVGDFMVRYANAITMVMFVALGGLILGDGIAGLTA
jgi:threonine/homoserine/homoserine lactone efflux protein